MVEAYKKYRQEENYSFLLQDMRIAMQSNFKALCQIYATISLNKNISTDDIWKEAKEKTLEMFDENFWNNSPRKVEDMTPAERKALDERNRKINLINEILRERSFNWLEKVYEKSKKSEKKSGGDWK